MFFSLPRIYGMRIIIGEIIHETNTFSNKMTGFEQWTLSGWGEGDNIYTLYPEDGTNYISGMIKAAKERSVETIPTICLDNAGPLIYKKTRDQVVDMLLKCLRDNRGCFDGICLGLHGAGVAEETPDLEKYILAEVRKEVGMEIPVTVTLDLHGNINQDFADLTNGLFGLKDYPHIDCADRGYDAMNVLVDILEGKYETETTVVRIPMFTNCCEACTFHNPMKEFKDYVIKYKEENQLIDATYFHGFPYSDVSYSGASAVVVAKKGYDSRRHANNLAKWIWENRHKLDVELLSPAQAIDRALEIRGEGFAVINEASDNPGGGCPGDGTWLLQELIKRNMPGTIMDYILDPEMANKAHESGVGAKISGMLGGHTDTIHGTPVEVKDAEVMRIGDGKVVLQTPMGFGDHKDYGKTALLRIGNVEVVVIEKLACQTLDDSLFVNLGISVDDYKIIGIKSTTHYRAFFQPIARACIPTNPPGIHTADYSILPYRNVIRPIYPLDPDEMFQ